jgi:hypothetical protein
MSVDSQDREYAQQGYTSTAVIDAGGTYQAHPDAYAEDQGHPQQQGYAPPHPDEFASEAEYREYMQHMEDHQRNSHGQEYPAQGYPQYDDGAASGYPAHQQQQGYAAPPPGYAGEPVREDKYSYTAR